MKKYVLRTICYTGNDGVAVLETMIYRGSKVEKTTLERMNHFYGIYPNDTIETSYTEA